MSKAPAFQFYPDKFITGTSHFTPAQVGAYIRLLCFQWESGSVPNDINMQARIAGCKKSDLTDVLKKFVLTQDGFINERLEESRVKQIRYNEAQKNNGLKGGRGNKKVNPNETQNKPMGFDSLIENETQTEAKKNPSSSSSSTEDIICINARELSIEFKEAQKRTCDFFGVGEIKNAQAYMQISNCIMLIEDKGELKYYLDQLTNYKKFKDQSRQQICNWQTWLLGSDNNLSSGHWCLADYEQKIKSIPTNDNTKLRGATEAIRSGNIKNFGKIEL